MTAGDYLLRLREQLGPEADCPEIVAAALLAQSIDRQTAQLAEALAHVVDRLEAIARAR